MANYLVQHFIDNSRELSGSKSACRFGNISITYEELFINSNKLANCLKSDRVQRQDRVAFCIRRSINSIIAIMGILKADAIYVPIDPKSPAERCATIIGDSQPSTLICDVESLDVVLDALTDMATVPKVVILEYKENLPESIKESLICKDDIDAQPSTTPVYKNIDTDTAYILYTSGSTGKPKGVVISHLNITNYISWAVEAFAISSMDNILSTAPFHFDMSTFDIYCAMMSGATLCIVPENYLLFPNKLLSWIEDQKATIWKVIPSLLVYLSKTDSLKEDRIPTIKKMLFGGESLPTKHLINWMKTFPDKLFYNVYGPTEATGISAHYFVEQIPQDPLKPIPIGKPCSNTEIFLLREDDSLANIGEVGELCIRGSGVSSGYWNDPEKTEKVFITNPINTILGDKTYRTGDLGRLANDGNFEFIGRKDFQVKYMGYRIELSEIENAILSVNEIVDATVVLSSSAEVGVPELIVFYESKNDLKPREIKKTLNNLLPPHMVPQLMIPLDKLPRTDRGKIDRPALNQLCADYHITNSRPKDAVKP